MKKVIFGLLTLLILLLFVRCEELLPAASRSNEVLAEPIGSMSDAQLSLHIKGDDEFARVFGVLDGLGPIFVQNSCESCHVGDGKGHISNSLIRFGKYNTQGQWDPMVEFGGPQVQTRAILNFVEETVPEGAQSTSFLAPNVTGLGYLAAVEDATILSMVDSLDSDNDGISGTINHISAPDWLTPDSRYHQALANGKYIGRFGRKSSTIDLKHQTVLAYKQDMGITSDFDVEDPINPFSSIFADDNAPDPEVPAATVNKVVFYLQTLEAPRRRDVDNAQVLEGEQLFAQVGCNSCHKATLVTGPSEVDALNSKVFHPYTDMLMHDMGNELDDRYTENTAETYEWRTMPLWGLGLQKDSQGGQMFLLHDGRAKSYEEAIAFHGGEASDSRSKYMKLSQDQKDQITKFLDSL